MTDRQRRSWDYFGATEPWFSVLTEERFRSREVDAAAIDAFYATGAADAERLLDGIRRHFGIDLLQGAALDFGCGAGRVAIAFAEQGLTVTGIDISIGMLDLARRHARETGFDARFVCGPVASVARRRYALVHSYIVLQHLPLRSGMDAVRALLDLVEEGGVAALHVTYGRGGSVWRRLGRWARHRSTLVNGVANLLRGERFAVPYMLMTSYDLNAVFREFAEAGCERMFVEPTSHGEVPGLMIVAQRRGGRATHPSPA